MNMRVVTIRREYGCSFMPTPVPAYSKAVRSGIMKSSRRSFMLTTSVFASSLVLSRSALAGAEPVSDSDATAQALGYKADATKVDTVKYPKYQTGQACVNCQYFQGKAGDAAGPCQIYNGKEVNATGWCSVYTRKA
ncbi:hypothetical protein P3T16_005595 [Paraburkholderia sp. GAS42]|jgi:hypothetical protein